MLKIHVRDKVVQDCVSIIVVPEKAMMEAGYIQTFSDKNRASTKHEFQAMAQMAYYQYQDDELSFTYLDTPISVTSDSQIEKIDAGMLLYRDTAGGFHALIHEGLPEKKMLEAAYRFCTRWVRLDI